MSKVIRGTIVFEFAVDEDELLSEMSEEEQFHYVRESIVEDIVNMEFGNSDFLYEAIEISVIEGDE